jgi:hypothetical protein
LFTHSKFFFGYCASFVVCYEACTHSFFVLEPSVYMVSSVCSFVWVLTDITCFMATYFFCLLGKLGVGFRFDCLVCLMFLPRVICLS